MGDFIKYIHKIAFIGIPIFLEYAHFWPFRKDVKTALGLGVCRYFFLGLTIPKNWLIDHYLLGRQDYLNWI